MCFARKARPLKVAKAKVGVPASESATNNRFSLRHLLHLLNI
jgi:hypothetical protein